MNERDPLAVEFEEQRARLLSVAYRMLGSRSEAEDAVQEAWLRLSRTSPGEVVHLGAWLTTVVGRISLNMLRSRKRHAIAHGPEPLIDRPDGTSPEHAALLANGVSLALLVVLEMLSPAERVAFILHDVFGMSFEEIGAVVERSADAARQLASRARRRVQDRNAAPDADLAAQRGVVDAFAAAARDGDLERLVAVLDPDVILRADNGRQKKPIEVHGADSVARRANAFSSLRLHRRPALVNGLPGLLCLLDDRPFSVMAFTVRGGKIAEIDILHDRARLDRVDLTALDGEASPPEVA